MNEFRHSQPIEYVLKCMKNNIPVDNFDIMNAIAQWEKIKNKKPVAYATKTDSGSLFDFRKTLGHNDNPYFTVALYLE